MTWWRKASVHPVAGDQLGWERQETGGPLIPKLRFFPTSVRPFSGANTTPTAEDQGLRSGTSHVPAGAPTGSFRCGPHPHLPEVPNPGPCGVAIQPRPCRGSRWKLLTDVFRDQAPLHSQTHCHQMPTHRAGTCAETPTLNSLFKPDDDGDCDQSSNNPLPSTYHLLVPWGGFLN